MKVLLLSTDSQIFNEASPVRARILEYGKLFEELCVIVYTRPGKIKENIGNVSLIPTNNRFRIGYFGTAVRLGLRTMRDGIGWAVSSQDPFETGWVAYRLKKALCVPFQVQIHTDFLSLFFAKGSLKHRFHVLLAKWLVKKADRIRVVSERIKKSLIALDSSLGNKITVLPIFVDKNKFSSAAAEHRGIRGFVAEDFLIITASRQAKEKNMDLANGIVGELKRRGHRIKWLHVGYPSQGGADVSLENSPVIAPYYKMADLFLLTSNYEGYGMAAVEAAAAGVPVVMTDVGVALGAVFPVGDREKAVAIIEDLIKDPEKRKRLVEKQNEFFRNWPTKEQYLEQFKKSLTF